MKSKIRKNKTKKTLLGKWLVFTFAVAFVFNISATLFHNQNPETAPSRTGMIFSQRAEAQLDEDLDGSGPIRSVSDPEGATEQQAQPTNPAVTEEKGENKVDPAGPASTNGIVPDFGAIFRSAINWTLYSILEFFGIFLGAIGFLFDWAVDPASIQMLNYPSVYNGWRLVRDFLNMFFIIILLFSAFATIFQIDQYNLKKILLTLIIMALLVNFSFPISRVVIDAANVPMYFFINAAFQTPTGQTSTSLSAVITKYTNLTKTLVPENSKANPNALPSQIIAAIVFVFITVITLASIAVLLVIRVLVLSLLVIFSPIGFVAAIFPATKGLSRKWWNYLFNQAFFGPAMALMLLLSIRLMQDIASSLPVEFSGNIASYGGADANAGTLANWAYYFIPVAVLWLGLMMAKSMGAVGATTVIGRAERVAAWGRGLPMRAGKGVWRSTGIPGGVKQAWEERRKKGVNLGLFKTGDRLKEREGRMAARLGGSLDEYEKRQGEKEVADEKEKRKNYVPADLIATMRDDHATEAERTASALVMAERGLITDIDALESALRAVGPNAHHAQTIMNKASIKESIADSAQYQRVRSALSPTMDPRLRDQLVRNIDDKIRKENNVQYLIDYEINNTAGAAASSTMQDAIYRSHLGRLNPQRLAEQKNLDPTSNPAFERYVRAELMPNNQRMLEAFRHLNNNQAAQWTRARLVPGGGAAPVPPARPPRRGGAAPPWGRRRGGGPGAPPVGGGAPAVPGGGPTP